LPDTPKKRQFWVFDPTIFQPGPKTSHARRFIIEPAKTVGRLSFFILVFTYPVTLVVLGILFGGLVFWGTLIGSIGLIGFGLWKGGYDRNYQAWNPNLARQLAGLSVGFGMTIAMFYGLFYLKLWVLPLFGGPLILSLVLILRRSSP
jgi:hypothetical protein